jgi:hypothetical protein
MKLECDSARGDFGSSDSPLSARRELGCGRGNTFGLRTGFAARFFIAKESRRANRNESIALDAPPISVALNRKSGSDYKDLISRDVAWW